MTIEEIYGADDVIYVDMRSPAEYGKGCIPGAVNAPLLSNEEREAIGIIYKNDSPDGARRKGLELVAPRLPDLIGRIRRHGEGRRMVIYCWRGGMRSGAIVDVLSLMGVAAWQLSGGYKMFRSYVLKSLAELKPPPLVVLCGSTGTGKTLVLEHLRRRGQPVLNLERLARHRGSVFGAFDGEKQTTAQNFDAALLSECRRWADAPYLVVECESRRIGDVYLPEALAAAMRRGRKICIRGDLDKRVERLYGEYVAGAAFPPAELGRKLATLRNRLGGRKMDELQALLAGGPAEVKMCIRILLRDYYDPLYGYTDADDQRYDFVLHGDEAEDLAESVLDYLKRMQEVVSWKP